MPYSQNQGVQPWIDMPILHLVLFLVENRTVVSVNLFTWSFVSSRIEIILIRFHLNHLTNVVKRLAEFRDTSVCLQEPYTQYKWNVVLSQKMVLKIVFFIQIDQHSAWIPYHPRKPFTLDFAFKLAASPGLKHNQ